MRLMRPALLLLLAGCPTTSTSPIGSYCVRLEDVSATYAALCPDLFGVVTQASVCPETVEGSCTEQEVDSLDAQLTCMELIVTCDELTAYSDCLDGVVKPSQTCAEAVETLFL